MIRVVEPKDMYAIRGEMIGEGDAFLFRFAVPRDDDDNRRTAVSMTTEGVMVQDDSFAALRMALQLLTADARSSRGVLPCLRQYPRHHIGNISMSVHIDRHEAD